MAEMPNYTTPWFWAAQAAIVPPMRLVMRMRVRGKHHLHEHDKLIVACNHISDVDPPAVGSAALPRKLYYMAKAELFEMPFLSFVLPRVGAFPVRRGESDRDAFRISREILADGQALLMFPEGTRHADGRLRPAQPGAGALALQEGVRVVPAAIWGSRKRFGPIRVIFGESIDFTQTDGDSRSERARRAADGIMAEIARLLPMAGGPAQPPPTND